jgi:hypothetical protein
MGATNWVWLEECNVKRLTAKAVLIEHDGEEHWLPLTQVNEPARLEVGDEGITIGITEWIASEKGIDV